MKSRQLIAGPVLLASTLLLAAGAHAAPLAIPAPADDPVPVAVPIPVPVAVPAVAPAVTTPSLFSHFSISGYGDLQFSWNDHNEDRSRERGALKDSRLTFDTTRFVLELEKQLPYGFQFEAEVEFEHGGTGSATELDHDEFGEIENDVEKGGEVILEELYLQRTFAGRHTVRVGRFYVAMGLLSKYSSPVDYLGTVRSEAETSMIPQVWDEMGVQYEGHFGFMRVTAQIVNGLDSTGFSSQNWVVLGHQRKFELVTATDLAGVARVDITQFPGIEFGASIYYGGTSRNRPKADLVPDCGAAAGSDQAAPCGYISAPLLIVDGHVAFHLGPVRGQAMMMWGRLWNAADISVRNDRLPNAIGLPRTPVADQALATWGEVGVDVAPCLGLSRAHALEPFVRLDYVDTMWKTRTSLFDNPRFARTIVAAGLSYKLGAVFAKLDWSRRSYGNGDLRPETTIRLSTGFVY